MSIISLASSMSKAGRRPLHAPVRCTCSEINFTDRRLAELKDTMPNLPTGTVTFLFTDIEGSSQLWNQHPDVMLHVMARHDELVEGAVQQHHGMVVRPRGEGDSRFAVFAHAKDAVKAAAAILEHLYHENWPLPTSLSARIALHT